MKLFRILPAPAVLVSVIGTLLAASAGHAYSITSFEWNEPITVRLTDGRRLDGLYRGSPGLVSATPYAERYAAWLDEVGLTSAPAIGETLLVTRKSGELLSGTFSGFADGDLLLATSDSCTFQVVGLNGQDVLRTNDAVMDPDWIAARGSWKSAPARGVIVLKLEHGVVAVPTSMIVSASPRASPGHSFMGGLLVGFLLGAVIAATAVASAYRPF